MSADALAPCVAMTSVIMLLTVQDWLVPVFPKEEFQQSATPEDQEMRQNAAIMYAYWNKTYTIRDKDTKNNTTKAFVYTAAEF